MSIDYQGSVQELNNKLEFIWREYFPDVPFESQAMGTKMSEQFSHEKQFSKIVFCFALLALVLSCLGSYITTSLQLARQHKEIGIRRALGAQASEIVHMVSGGIEVSLWYAVVISLVVTNIIAFFWLSQFPYRFDMWWLVPLSIVATTSVFFAVKLVTQLEVIRFNRQQPATYIYER